MGSPVLVGEDDRAYTVDAGNGQPPVRIAKSGLSPEFHQKIRGLPAMIEQPLPQQLTTADLPDPMLLPPSAAAPAGRPASFDLATPPTGAELMQRPKPQMSLTMEEPRIVAPPEAPSYNQQMTAAMTVPGGLPNAIAAGGRDANIDAERMKSAEDKKRLGLIPGKDAEIPGAGGPPPVAPHAQAPTRVGMTSTKDPGLAQSLSGLDAEKQARVAVGEAAGAAGEAQAKYLQGFNEQAKAHEMEAEQRRNRAMVQTQDMLAKQQAAVDEMKNISTTVDPGRYWAAKSTGQKILGVIGLAVGALGASRDGINKAAVMMQAAIDRDLEAQKAELGARMQLGKAKVDAAAGSYAATRQRFQDEAAADAAWKAGAWDMAKGKLMEIDAMAKGPAEKAQAQLLNAVIDQKKGEQQSQAGEFAQKANYQNQSLALEAKKLDAAAGRGAGMDQKQQSQLMEIGEREKEIQQSGASLLKYLDQYGTGEKMAPGVEAKMNQAINGMIIASAKMQDREGVVREPDEARERKSLGFEPGFFQRTESARVAIKSYMENAERRRNNALSVRGLR